jgi:hypothetical protein
MRAASNLVTESLEALLPLDTLVDRLDDWG